MKSTTTTSEPLDVYDFVDEADVGKRFTKKEKVKEKNKAEKEEKEEYPLDEYKFIEFFSRETSGTVKEVRNVECLEVDAGDSDNEQKIHDHFLRSSDGDCLAEVIVSEIDELHFEKHSHIDIEDTESGESVRLNSLKMNALSLKGSNSTEMDASNLELPSTQSNEENYENPDLSFDDEPVDVILDEENSVQISSSSFSSDIVDNEDSMEDSAYGHCYRVWETEEGNLAVSVYPDYLIYQDKYYCTDSALTFLYSSVKIEGTNACGKKESFSFECSIDEISSVESHWFPRVETALVYICTRNMDVKEANATETTPGAVKVKFAVSEYRWPDIHEKIMSIDARYKAVWKLSCGFDERAELSSCSSNKRNCSDSYFPSFDEPFEEVIYPKGDPDAVSISKRDVELLQPETFINDTVVDFYIKYLDHKICKEDKQRFHFFNSFFFRKLADLDKNPSSASEGRAAFQRVRKWTRKVNLFEKDYIFIPVNFNLHWSLLVICYPGEVAKLQDEDFKGSPKVPCILHMDSIRGSHMGVKNLIQSYLSEEWKERQGESSKDVAAKLLSVPFVSLEVPQQENSYDCGLFLLHYVERFLQDAPVHFCPFTKSKFSNFLSMDWFTPAEASLKRAVIQKLIYDILQNDSQRILPTGSGYEDQCTQFERNRTGGENTIELLTESNKPGNSCNDNSLSFSAKQETEKKSLPRSLGNAQHVGRSQFICDDLIDPGTCGDSLPNGHFQSSNQTQTYLTPNGPSPFEEDVQTGEHFVYSSPSVRSSPPLAEFSTSKSCKSRTPRLFNYFGSLDPASWNPEVPVIYEEDEVAVSSSETSGFVPPSPSDARLDQNQRSHSPENSQSSGEIPAVQSKENFIVQGSLDAEEEEEEVEEETHNYLSSYHEADESIDPVDLARNLKLQANDIALEPDERRVSKRQRIMPQLGKV